MSLLETTVEVRLEVLRLIGVLKSQHNLKLDTDYQFVIEFSITKTDGNDEIASVNVVLSDKEL